LTAAQVVAAMVRQASVSETTALACFLRVFADGLRAVLAIDNTALAVRCGHNDRRDDRGHNPRRSPLRAILFDGLVRPRSAPALGGRPRRVRGGKIHDLLPAMSRQQGRPSAIERWPIDRLAPNARNARRHRPSQVAEIVASIRHWGWTMPVRLTSRARSSPATLGCSRRTSSSAIFSAL